MITIATHDGYFHADELLACFLIKEIIESEDDEVRIIRTRYSDWDTYDYVVDVGSVYDPSKKRFDHHMYHYKGDFSSFGMVYDYMINNLKIHSKFIAKSLALTKKIDMENAFSIIEESNPEWLEKVCQTAKEMFVDGIDANDNGIKLPTLGKIPIQSIVYRYNYQNCSKNEYQNLQFEKCSQLLGQIFTAFVSQIFENKIPSEMDIDTPLNSVFGSGEYKIDTNNSDDKTELDALTIPGEVYIEKLQPLPKEIQNDLRKDVFEHLNTKMEYIKKVLEEFKNDKFNHFEGDLPKRNFSLMEMRTSLPGDVFYDVMFKIFVENIRYYYLDKSFYDLSYNIVERVFKNNTEGENNSFLVFKEPVFIYKLENIVYKLDKEEKINHLVYPEDPENENTYWRVKALRKNFETFESRRPLKYVQEVFEKTVFVHKSKFIAVLMDYESALVFVKKNNE